MTFVCRLGRKSSRGGRWGAHLVEALESRLLLAGTASISGTVWNDLNANGAWEASDTRIQGWTVYLDSNNNSSLDAGEPSTVTDNHGLFSFTNLNAGTYTVRYVAQGGYTATLGWADHATVTLSAGQAMSGVAFGMTLANGQVSGTVLNVGGGGSSPLAGFGAYLDLNGNGKLDPADRWIGTDAQGHFSFQHLQAGMTYSVRIDPPHPTWTISPQVINVTSDGTSTVPITFKLTPNNPPATYNASQLIDYWLIGGQSADNSTRDVGTGLLNLGWTNFVSQYIQPDIAWGVRRIELHNPFGALTTDSVFRADQYLEAQAAGLSGLTSNFASAWKPVTSSGVEVIAYIGSPDQDPSFQALVNDPAAWNARFQASIAPILAAGMSIAFDMGQWMTQGDLYEQALMSLQGQGVKVYLENRPGESETYTWPFPVIAADWDATSPYVDASNWWAAKNSELPPGNVVELFQSGVASDPATAINQVQAVFYKGDCAGVHVADLMAMGLKMQQVLTPPKVPTLTGDLNGDGTVGLADMTLLNLHFGMTTAPFQDGDLNGDGTVNLADLLIFTRNFGKTAPAVTASASPSAQSQPVPTRISFLASRRLTT